MGDQIEAKGEAVPQETTGMVTVMPRVSRTLYSTQLAEESEGRSLLDTILKTQGGESTPSNQGVSVGRKSHPFNFDIVARFQTVNVHHGRSIHAKVAATVGLGFETPNDKKKNDAKITGEILSSEDLPPEDDVSVIDTNLNPLCEHSWQDALNDVAEDYWTTGNGYLEAVRNDSKQIVGLHHIPMKEVYVVIEDLRYNRHYEIQGTDDSSSLRLFAKFGDLDGFLARNSKDSVASAFAGEVSRKTTAEVIHFRRPTSLSRWYGFPDWLAATAAIELMQCVTQHEYDFFLNRGVPEFMLFIMGQGLNAKDKEKIETAMQSTIGLGNQSKSLLINLVAGKDSIQVQLEKLAMENKGDGSQFSATSESLALQIVTAHGVPPLLAGIQIPGKLGASNEMIQAMQAFQTLVIEPAQRQFRQTLLNTLGSDDTLGLTAGDLVFNTITDAIDVKTADTAARMRQSPQEAAAEGRNLEDGVKKEWTDEERGRLIGQAMDALLTRIMGRAA